MLAAWPAKLTLTHTLKNTKKMKHHKFVLQLMHWRQIHTFDPMPSRFSKCCCNSDTLLNVFLAIAVDNLANAQELTKVGRLRFLSAKPNISYVVPCFHCGAFLFWLRGWRMKRSRKRRPIRSWHCRRRWKWRKSAPCQLPTFRLLRKF